MRYTVKDVRTQVEHLEPLLKTVGILKATERLILSEGSKTYGRAWRLNLGQEGSYTHYSLPWISDYLGMTASEAWDTLLTIRNTVNAVLDAQKAVDVRASSVYPKNTESGPVWACCESSIGQPCAHKADES